MFKAVKKPKEYAVIKVPKDCEDVGKFVIEEAKTAGAHLDISTTYDDYYDKWVTTIETGNGTRSVNPGSVIVGLPEGISVLSQEDFDKKFKPVDDPVKANGSMPVNLALDGFQIKGIELPARLGFSESFIAELDKALNDYHQKQARY